MSSTLKDVAKKGGVGYATASRVLNGASGVSEATRRKVLKAAQELGYEPNEAARNLVMQGQEKKVQQGTMAFAVPSHEMSLNRNLFRGNIYLAALDAVHCRGLRMVFTPVELDEDGTLLFRGLLSLNAVDGILVLGNEFTSPEMLNALRALNVPVVMMDYSCPDYDLHAVSIHNEGGIRQAVHRLVDMGHREVGILNGPFGHPSARARRRGFLEAVEEFGVTFCKEWDLKGEFTLESGKDAAEALSSLSSRPTAIVCASDLMACGVLQGLSEKGIKVPDDVSVLGFDDLEAELTVPPLTSVHVDMASLGRMGAERLLALQDEPETEPYESVIKTWLVERASCSERNVSEGSSE